MAAGINIFINVLKKSFSFSGRIDRRQYWLFILLMLVIMAVCAWFTNKIPSLPLWQIFAILMLLPYVSATAKRLHDIDKSGFWFLSILVPVFGWIYLFVLTIENGEDSTNRYGYPQDWAVEKNVTEELRGEKTWT